MIHACIKDTLELFFLFFLILINADCEESWAVEDRYIHSTVRFKDECGSWISFHAAVQTHVVFCFKSVTSGGKKTQREREARGQLDSLFHQRLYFNVSGSSL